MENIEYLISLLSTHGPSCTLDFNAPNGERSAERAFYLDSSSGVTLLEELRDAAALRRALEILQDLKGL